MPQGSALFAARRDARRSYRGFWDKPADETVIEIMILAASAARDLIAANNIEIRKLLYLLFANS